MSGMATRAQNEWIENYGTHRGLNRQTQPFVGRIRGLKKITDQNSG